jgi:hypothetical protein
MIYTYASTVTDKSQDVYGIYLYMANIAPGSRIRLANEVIVSMIT